jgi:hypothetical protein
LIYVKTQIISLPPAFSSPLEVLSHRLSNGMLDYGRLIC